MFEGTYHFSQVYTVVTKRSVTPDPTTNQKVRKKPPPPSRRPPPRSSKSPPSNPSQPISIPTKPPPPKNVLNKFSPSARPTRPPPPTKPARPKVPFDETDVDYDEVDDDDFPPVGEAKPNVIQNAGNNPQNVRERRHIPSYDEVVPDQHILVEPLPLRQSAHDNDMWAQFKFQTLPTPRSDSLTHRSTSSSNLTTLSSSDYYSNLADITVGIGSSGEMLASSYSPHQPRRHSFSEGEERLIVVKGTANR